MTMFRFKESRDSRASTHDPPTYTSRWKASGSNDSAYVKAFAFNATPAMVSTLAGVVFRQDIRVEPVGFEQFAVEVTYGRVKRITGDYSLNFDTSGGTIHLTNSLETVASYGSSPPDHKQLIGVNGDSVDGVDAVIPALKINVQFKHPLGFVSIPRIKALANWTGAVNSTGFLDFAAGEVLFLGARGQEGSDTETTLEYSFAMSANATGLTIGDLTVDKEGHDYLWLQWKDVVSNNRTAKQPEFGYVERIYPRGDLAAILGFGG